MSDEIDSKKERSERPRNPFGGAALLKEDVTRNNYSKEFKKAFIMLFAKNNLTFLEMTKKLGELFPGYTLSTDKIKAFYTECDEECLEARDEHAGLFDIVDNIDRLSLFKKSRRQDLNTLESLLDTQESLVKSLGELDPVDNCKAHSTVVASLERVNKMIGEMSGTKDQRILDAARAKMMLAVDIKKIMIKEGLLPEVTKPQTLPQLDPLGSLINKGIGKKGDYRPAILEDAEVIEIE